ncbi:ragulator complex protein LAMTOR5 homolog [Agrilus planipennis]|uniref:Late endosomal/lysosomal adaptor and MAPK and MTOR activator 5 n=1 Tax=Agrilus planipennis TaxID=224129 RepID=A0A1W4X2D7_AGRPL|nr:ragulator complex protein LAMTOR5 homolog [Agrilus planipennis]
MEKQLDRVMDEVLTVPGISGCIFSDKQGLCIGVKGKASAESAGIMSAIANQVAKLEPDNKSPIIVYENDNQSCIIQQQGDITAAIYKTGII